MWKQKQLFYNKTPLNEKMKRISWQKKNMKQRKNKGKFKSYKEF